MRRVGGDGNHDAFDQAMRYAALDALGAYLPRCGFSRFDQRAASDEFGLAVHDDEDVIGSVANYFHQHGWKMNETVVQAANLRGSLSKRLATNSKRADYEYQRLVRSGVAPVGYAAHHPAKAGLIELTTDAGQVYWLAYPNFYVITRYNTSPQYALVVYLLSQQLAGRWATIAGNNARA